MWVICFLLFFWGAQVQVEQDACDGVDPGGTQEWGGTGVREIIGGGCHTTVEGGVSTREADDGDESGATAGVCAARHIPTGAHLPGGRNDVALPRSQLRGARFQFAESVISTT